MSLYGWFKRPGPNGFGYNSTAEQVTDGLDLSGKVFLLTGSNSGLGEEVLRVLALRGARVIATARTLDKAAASIQGVPGDPVPIACELSEPASVRAAVEAVRATGLALDGIIANAGIMALPERVVKHGLELQFLTNHIGHFILVTGLLDRLTEHGRVVVLSSSVHTATYPEGIRFDDLDAAKGYTPWGAYGQSKLANLLFANALAASHLPQSTQRANSVHPGVIATNLKRHLSTFAQTVFVTFGPGLALKTTPQGAATEVYVATHPGAAEANGLYFADCNPATPSAFGRDAELARRLWETTEAIVARLDQR